jgi:hypothetical protein
VARGTVSTAGRQVNDAVTCIMTINVLHVAVLTICRLSHHGDVISTKEKIVFYK